MAEPFLLIDGYNLMHAAGMARRTYGPGDLERCRTRFVRFLVRHLTAAERCRATVVFDAAEAPSDAARQHRIEEMTVLFAPAGGDADALVEDLIAAHSAPRRVRVVSSDRRLRAAARRRRAQAVPSERFLAELERRGALPQGAVPSAPTPDAKFTGCTTDEETREWLDVFGDVGVPAAPAEPPPASAGRASPAPHPPPEDAACRDKANRDAPAGNAARQNRPPPDGARPSDEELRMWEARVAELWEEGD